MRHIYQSAAKDGMGRIIPSMTVSVYRAGGTTAANVYTASTGGSPVTSVTTAADGSFAFYVSDSDFSLNQKFKITLTKTDFATKSYDNITIFAPVPTAIYAFMYGSPIFLIAMSLYVFAKSEYSLRVIIPSFLSWLYKFTIS